MNSSVFILFIPFILLARVNSHTFLSVPKGDFKTYNKPECRMGGPLHSPDDNCPGPCIAKDTWQYDKNSTSTTYARGQNVTMVWARNNHVGGFVRFALVPEKERMNRLAHQKMAFRYACFESDKHLCHLDTSKERRCGTDKYLYRTNVTIPTALPDGKYVLGFVWYGGLSMKASYFADYWSCSDVLIQGGPFTQTYRPSFIPGKNITGVARNKPSCPSAVNEIGICKKEPCFGIEGNLMKPITFMGNKQPPAINSSWISYATPSPEHDENDNDRTDKNPVSQAWPTITATPLPTPSSTVAPAVVAGPCIHGLEMINTDTNAVLHTKFNRTVHVTNGLNISFVALTTGRIKYVSFFLNNRYVRTEMSLPYTFWGDIRGKSKPWPNPIFNQWIKITVRATPYDRKAILETFWLRLSPPQSPSKHSQ